MEVDHTRRMEVPGIVIGADEKNATGFDGDGLGARLFFVNGVNISIEKEKIRLRFTRAR